MQIETGTVIPAGYLVKVTTWENDGDDYDTCLVSGLTEQEKDFLVYIIPLFKSAHVFPGEVAGYGNEDATFALMAGVVEIAEANGTQAQVQRFFNMSCEEIIEYIDDDCEDAIDDFMQEAQAFLSIPMSYDDTFVRVVETVEVVYLDKEIVFPTIPTGQVVFKR